MKEAIYIVILFGISFSLYVLLESVSNYSYNDGYNTCMIDNSDNLSDELYTKEFAEFLFK